MLDMLEHYLLLDEDDFYPHKYEAVEAQKKAFFSKMSRNSPRKNKQSATKKRRRKRK